MQDENQQYGGGIHISSVSNDDTNDSSDLHIGHNTANQKNLNKNELNNNFSEHSGIKINHIEDSNQDNALHIANISVAENKNDDETSIHILNEKQKEEKNGLNIISIADQSNANLQSNQNIQQSDDFHKIQYQLANTKKDMTNSIEFLFDYTREHFASDLHISAGSVPKIRLYGQIQSIPNQEELLPEKALLLIHQTMTEELKKEFKEKLDVDYSFKDSQGRRYRCNAMMNINGPSGVFRIISDKIISFDELGLPESLRKIENLKKGMVLVTGPSGCGKSTTLATLVDMVNRNDEGHILTIEDPVEILHKSKKSLVNHREIKTHTKSFARALKSALREDPDCIMIGEMRDLETISLALTAAETGHLVFGTLHTSSAAKTITRIIDVFPFGEQGQIRAMLSEGIQCVISQVLCRRKDGNGRVAAFEVMFGTDAIKNLIRSDKIYQINSAIEVGMKDGMQTIDQALKKLVLKGIVDVEEARLYAKSPEDF